MIILQGLNSIFLITQGYVGTPTVQTLFPAAEKSRRLSPSRKITIYSKPWYERILTVDSG